MWTLCCPEFGRYKILLMTNIFVSAYFERISIKIWLNWQLVLKNLGWAVDFDIEWRWFWVTSHYLHNYCLNYLAKSLTNFRPTLIPVGFDERHDSSFSMIQYIVIFLFSNSLSENVNRVLQVSNQTSCSIFSSGK